MTKAKMKGNNIGVILLAAGQSSRLGRPKQLLVYDGSTLLQHSLQVACSSNAHPIVVVLGAQADTIRKELEGTEATLIVNAAWQEGMASSIQVGVKALVQVHPAAEGCILMVCDQPYVTALLLNELITAYQRSGKPIVTCSYSGTFGPPTLFHKSLFSELLQLTGDVGARSILRQHVNDVEVIFFSQGVLDIDTEVDYERIKREDVQ